MLGPGFCALAAARAAATLAAAADGLTAVVEEVALLAVDDIGLVVVELLNPELDLDDVVAGFDGAGVLVTPVADDGLLVAALLVVADEAFDTAGLGRALDVELAFDACLDTVGVGLGLVAGGRGSVEEVGRFGSDLVCKVLVSVGLCLDG